MRQITKATAFALGLFAASGAMAESWTLDGDSSVISFGSIKNNSNGEVHRFTGLSGGVGADGIVSIELALGTVETNIEIRNERMIEHVFQSAPTATLTARVSMDDFEQLAVGDSTITDIEGDITFLGQDIPVFVEVFVLRTAEDQVMVGTNSMIFVSTEDLGVTAGIDKLMELADLQGITRTSPVTFRLMFDAVEEQEI